MDFLEIKRKSKILYFLLIFLILFCSASFSYADTGTSEHATFYSAFETWLIQNRYNERIWSKSSNLSGDPFKDYNIVIVCDYKESKYYYLFERKTDTGTNREFKVLKASNSESSYYMNFGFHVYFESGSPRFLTGGGPGNRKKEELKILGRLFLQDDGNINRHISDEFKNDVGVETIRFDVPTSNSLVKQDSQEIVIALSHLKYKAEFLKFGKTDWGEKVSKSGYSYKFYINDNLVVPSGVRYFKVQSVNTVMSAFYYSEFEDMKEYKLKAELYKDNKLISTNVINVFCQSTFTDLNGDGIDDNTGFKIPNRNPISIFDDWFRFISSLFSSFAMSLTSALTALKDFIATAGSFFETVASVFTADQTLRNMILLSFGTTVFLRILGR